MSNNTRPRKVNESLHLSSSSASFKLMTNKIELKSTFNEILTTFIGSDLDGFNYVQSKGISTDVKQLLSSLKVLLGRLQVGRNDRNIEIDINNFKTITELVHKVLCRLNGIISNTDDVCYPETMTLAGLCTVFLLLVYFTFFVEHFSNSNNEKNVILATAEVYFSLFAKEIELNDIDCLLLSQFTTEFPLVNRMERIAAHFQSIPAMITFRYVSLFYGFLNSGELTQLILNNSVYSFVSIFESIHRLAKMGTIESNYFHVVRLQDQYFKVLLENRKLIIEKLTLSSYLKTIDYMIGQTFSVLNANWESPVSGVSTCIRQTYNSLIESAAFSALDRDQGKPFREILHKEFLAALNLPYTARSKYRKLSTLYRNLKGEDVQYEGENFCPSHLWMLPFHLDDNFAYAIFEHLSINSLATPIAEFYKSYVNHIFEANVGKLEAVAVWKKLWLKPFVRMFQPDETTLSSSTVVQNCLLSHIFPYTLNRLPEVIDTLYEGFADNPFGQVSLIHVGLERGLLDKNLIQLVVDPKKWLTVALCDADDMTRAEALGILLNERLLAGDRKLTYKLVLKFMAENMNVDNAPFRQKMLCKLEQFYARIFESLEVRIKRDGDKKKVMTIADDTNLKITFLHGTFNVVAKGIIPGSSFQRKYTALNVLSFLLKSFKNMEGKLTNGYSLKDTIIGEEFAKYGLGQKQLSIYKLLLLCLIDKDDKIRRLTSEMIIKYEQWNYVQTINEGHNKDIDQLLGVSMQFVNSPRHQEAHIGGLLIKYLFRTKLKLLDRFQKTEDFLLWFTDSFERIFKLNNNIDLVHQARYDPLHGWMLTINQCFTFDSIYEGLSISEQTTEDRYQTIMFHLRSIFQRWLTFAEETIRFFLDLLTPDEGTGGSELFDENDGDLALASSPSFYEMCQSIQAIIEKNNKKKNGEGNDIFQSNDFQLILSMAWLNIKEACFLLANMVTLFADLLSYLVNLPCFSIDLGQTLLTEDELYRIGVLLLSIMLRCRHKGVIEGCGVALTKVIRNQLRIIFHLTKPTAKQMYPGRPLEMLYIQKFEALVEQIFNTINGQTRQRETLATATNITRRSAGLAYVVQAVLVGEAEATNADGLRTFFTSNIYDRAVAILMENATVSVRRSQAETLQEVDLPQANALHVLQSIVGTSALSHLTIKTVSQLLPICIRGFSSPYWQIRNASLQLFGACTTRILGQKKRTKTTKEIDLGADFSATITFKEFIERYPELFDEIVKYLEGRADQSLHPDVVPILALLASFTPGDAGDLVKKEMKNHLERFLSNRIWKIRMLTARAMANVLSIEELDKFVCQKLKEMEAAGSLTNYLHGLLCVTEVLFELKAATIFKDREATMKKFREEFRKLFKPCLNKCACPILDDLAGNIFEGLRACPLMVEHDDEDNKDNEEANKIDNKLSRMIGNNPLLVPLFNQPVPADLTFFQSILNVETLEHSKDKLKQIKANVIFRKPAEVRMAAAEDLDVLVVDFVANIKEVNNQISLSSFLYLVNILQTLLEDEEREIRMVGQKTIYRLIMTVADCDQYFMKASDVHLKQMALCPTVSIEALYRWATITAKKNCYEMELYQFLIVELLHRFEPNELESLLTMEKIIKIDNNIEKCNNYEELILFEKEEKNVYAEPYRIALAIEEAIRRLEEEEHFLKMSLSLDIQMLFDQKVLNIMKRLDKKRMMMMDIPIEVILKLSIWRLPKVFANFIILKILAQIFYDKEDIKDKICFDFCLH